VIGDVKEEESMGVSGGREGVSLSCCLFPISAYMTAWL